MRRPVLYLAGLLLATGASLALAGPASAAPSRHHHHCNHSDGWHRDNDELRFNAQNDGSEYRGLINVLNGISTNGGDGGLLGGGFLL